jgi:23S rRNA pseudouridine1911/1915/1917 synthase
MVVAKRSKAANRLTESLQNGSLKRAYLAWVQGELTGSGTWRHLLLKDEATNTVKVVKSKVSGAKEAVLNWESKGVHSLSGQKISLIQLVLETGRSHQIRVQASAEGHPLLGDLKYGGNSFGNLVTRTALHSSDLEFPHPMSGEKMKFHVPFPKADDPI